MNDILEVVYEALTRPLSIKELFEILRHFPKNDIQDALHELEAQGRILKNKKKRYAKSEFFGIVPCTFGATEKAFAFGIPIYEKNTEDIFIPPGQSRHAWHGDKILVKLNPKPSRNRRREGAVVSVLSRSVRTVIGRLEKGRAYYVQPSKRYPLVDVSMRKLMGAKVGDKVEVKITFYGDAKYPAQGVISHVFGEDNTLKTAAAAILHQNGIFEEFPTSVTDQAKTISQVVTDITGREDLRDKVIFTIDGDTAKDFDDAVSLEPLENGRMILGVHIADVSHYVTYESPLDREAWNRGTSVYFADKVVPMLPFELSNGICSLNPNVDRYAFSGFLETDSSGRVYSFRFAKSVINSKERMTYTNVNKILDGDEELCARYAHIKDTLVKMNDLAINMRKNRMIRGALELDIPEAAVLCDENGIANEVVLRTRGQSEMLIEEFMLACNEAAAEFMLKADYPAVYRVHEMPDPNKLKVFSNFARMFGYKIPKGQEDNTHVLGDVLKQSKGKPEEKTLSVMLLRSLARARYASECLGHYGLSSKFYLHFTSPIRRYPDLITHRMMQNLLEGVPESEKLKNTCTEAAVQSSSREMAADTAERDVEKLYMAQYMSKHIGQSFDAVVSSVQGFGMFVELPNTIEGLVRLESIKDDYYEYNEEKLTLTGKHTGRKFSIGTAVHVKLIAASEVSGQIDFILDDENNDE